LNSPVTALSCPLGDVDLYRLQVTHATRINVEMFTPEQWRPVMSDTRRMQAHLEVYAPDSTLLARKGWPMSQKDSFQLSFDADQAGAYYIHAWTYLGGFRFTYTLRASETLYRAPGDPVVTFVDSLSVGDIAVSTTGDLYVASWGKQILKISPSGAVTEFVNGLSVRDLAFDGLGNLYATAGDYCCDPGSHALYRIAPDGQYTLLTHELGSPYGLAIAPDGSIWLGEYLPPRSLRRYDPSGRLLASYGVSGLRDGGVSELAFSPAGELYAATTAAIYRFQSGRFEEVLQGEPFIKGFAIDSAGRIYVANQGYSIGAYGGEGRIDLYDANGTVIMAPFARTPVVPGRLAFGRNSDGSPNRRLFFNDQAAIFYDRNRIGEVRPGSVEIPGAREPMSYQRAIRELLRPGSVLKAEERDALDAGGNKNGRYDIGDLRILLVRAGALP
jgi:sugar lactone lactonase YvrE